jgi:hypothetical protein
MRNGGRNLHYEILCKYFTNIQVAPQSTHYQPDLITTKLADYIETNGAVPKDSAKLLQPTTSSPKIAMKRERSQPNHRRHYRCSSSRGLKYALETTRKKWSLLCRPGRESAVRNIVPCMLGREVAPWIAGRGGGSSVDSYCHQQRRQLP